MPLKLIIFDLDGTLVDTARDIAEALNHAIKPLGLGPASVEETKALIGEGMSRLVEKALAPLGKKANAKTEKEVLEKFLDYYSKNLTVHSRLYPTVKEALWKLYAFDKAVLSNKREALSKTLLEDLGVAADFILIAGGDTVSAKKPSPESVLHVLKATGALPGDALMVGDSPYDIEAARGAGVTAVGLTSGYRDRSLLSGADYLIDDLLDIMPLLLKIKAVSEKRIESRFTVVPVCRKYIVLNVKSGNGFSSAALLDISRRGLMFKSPARFEPGEEFECEVSIPGSLSRSVGIKGIVRHCARHSHERYNGEYYCGAEILEVSSKLWFRVFGKVCDYIREREGKVF